VTVLSIDLGSGKRPRGDVGITLPSGDSTVDVTSGIDQELAQWCWPVRRGVPVVEGDLEEEETWCMVEALVGEFGSARFLLSHVLEHVREPWALLTRVMSFQPVDVTVVVPNASVSRADWVDPQHRFSWTGGSLMNLVSAFGVVKRVGWFGPVMDLAVQFTP
jgi:hypothetical protein